MAHRSLTVRLPPEVADRVTQVAHDLVIGRDILIRLLITEGLDARDERLARQGGPPPELCPHDRLWGQCPIGGCT